MFASNETDETEMTAEKMLDLKNEAFAERAGPKLNIKPNTMLMRIKNSLHRKSFLANKIKPE